MVAEPTALSLNVDAVPMRKLQCSTRWMSYVVMEDVMPTEVDAVSLCCMQCACCATSAVCTVSAVIAVPTALSENVDAIPCHWMQCPTRCMQYVVT